MTTGVSGQLPEYWRDLYGDSTIGWVPPVTNYLYAENVSQRGIRDRTFRWGESAIDITTPQSGAILDFLMPDTYLLQITPDLGWHDTLAMFGEGNDVTLHNPHLRNLGPFSIENGTLTDNADNSVQIELSSGQITSAVIDGYNKYVWRAVPWAQGNPGLGGLPASFEWISTVEQLHFTVDPIAQETKKSVQVVSGTKGPRVSISTDTENSVAVFVEQTSTTWKVVFNIDRPRIKFRIIATDDGGSAIGFYQVDLTYKDFGQYSAHAWNSFDGFALLASLERLPGESNDSLKARTVDAFTNKGGTHYRGLINGINRELGLHRKDNAIKLERALKTDGTPVESQIDIECTHSRVSVHIPSYVIYDEIKQVDPYNGIVETSKRIKEIISIRTISNQEIPNTDYKLSEEIGHISNREIVVSNRSGLVKITYQYKEDLNLDAHTTVDDIVAGLRALINQSGLNFIKVTLDGTMSGSELSKYLYKTSFTLSSSNKEGAIGWSRIGLFAVSDEEYKWSYASEDNTFFNSAFYEFVLELKSKTNIEWGFVVADKDYWDAIDADWYGRDSLPTVFDVKLAKYVTAIPIGRHDIQFDPWEAFRMAYYYNGNLIKNVGFPQIAFRSGVGYKRDCAVSVATSAVSSAESKVNLSPIVVQPKDTFDLTQVDLGDYLIDI